MTTHYFWCLCPDDVKQGDRFTLDPELVTCSACLEEMEKPISETPEDNK